MKSVKGKLSRKLKSIKPVGYLKPDRVLQALAIDGFTDSFSKAPIPDEQDEQPKLFTKASESEHENIKVSSVRFVENQPEVIAVTELMKDLESDDDEEEELGLNEEIDDKENITPHVEKENANMNCRQSTCAPLSEIDVSCFRKPDLNSCTLFDPNLLVVFEQAVKEHMKMNEEERRAWIEQDNVLEKKTRTLEDSDENSRKGMEKKARIHDEDANGDPLLGFEEKCPAGVDGSVILYTTTLKGIRKTFEDCNSLRFLLESFRVIFYERDVSMHTEYREELWRILGGRVMPPRLFIKGRYIGGADEVLTLHEQGKLKMLFNGVPMDTCNGACEGCGGVRFVLCFVCNGSHKIISDDGLSSKCMQCNENGLIVCPLCS
ncbi:putative two-component sensor protein histidine protein kinase [Hibiscus syriacus]|uniref:Two-component sensor protein histidine protein kinase n=1 Tax=Hibiscus syriacus TaxID=106335 RepID=A0A6A2YG14_HIBSY|nr:uncharacterized protein At3g28850-like [Hibiscus syriacus]KAE8678566.1 putative two-component sensor protein histidine protein kinase [Hibiscus syriacus]